MFWLPIALLTGGGLAAYFVREDAKTAEKTAVAGDLAKTTLELDGAAKSAFDKAMNVSKDPKAIKALADAFVKQGSPALVSAADLLTKRANLLTLPRDVVLARRKAFKDGMKSAKPDAIQALAVAFENQGATGAADALRKHAQSITAAA